MRAVHEERNCEIDFQQKSDCDKAPGTDISQGWGFVKWFHWECKYNSIPSIQQWQDRTGTRLSNSALTDWSLTDHSLLFLLYFDCTAYPRFHLIVFLICWFRDISVPFVFSGVSSVSARDAEKSGTGGSESFHSWSWLSRRQGISCYHSGWFKLEAFLNILLRLRSVLLSCWSIGISLVAHSGLTEFYITSTGTFVVLGPSWFFSMWLSDVAKTNSLAFILDTF